MKRKRDTNYKKIYDKLKKCENNLCSLENTFFNIEKNLTESDRYEKSSIKFYFYDIENKITSIRNHYVFILTFFNNLPENKYENDSIYLVADKISDELKQKIFCECNILNYDIHKKYEKLNIMI